MNRILGCAGLALLLALPLSLNAQDQEPPPPPPPQQGPPAPLGAPPQYSQNPPRDTHTFNHMEVGAYGDLFRLNSTNFLGLGARLAVNVHPNVALEAEMNYDFERNYTSITVNNGGGGGTTSTYTSRVRPLTALFGPKFQFGTSGPFRAFLTGKAGFVELSHSTNAPSGTSFGNSFDQFGGSSTHFAAYPGGGIEGFLGPIGLRLEAGDEIYLDNGANNNLRVTFGPTFRF
jgi:hypothetical protein